MLPGQAPRALDEGGDRGHPGVPGRRVGRTLLAQDVDHSCDQQGEHGDQYGRHGPGAGAAILALWGPGSRTRRRYGPQPAGLGRAGAGPAGPGGRGPAQALRDECPWARQMRSRQMRSSRRTRMGGAVDGFRIDCLLLRLRTVGLLQAGSSSVTTGWAWVSGSSCSPRTMSPDGLHSESDAVALPPARKSRRKSMSAAGFPEHSAAECPAPPQASQSTQQWSATGPANLRVADHQRRHHRRRARRSNAPSHENSFSPRPRMPIGPQGQDPSDDTQAPERRSNAGERSGRAREQPETSGSYHLTKPTFASGSPTLTFPADKSPTPWAPGAEVSYPATGAPPSGRPGGL